jgi:predicted Ser/Thr protein kinase
VKVVTSSRAPSWRGIAAVLREAFSPGDDGGWWAGYSAPLALRIKLLTSTVWVLGNLTLLAQMLKKPDLDPHMAVLSVVLMNGLLVADLALSAAFLRHWSRWYPLVCGISMGLILSVGLVWIEMTGSVTSYFIGALFMGLTAVRVLATYRMSAILTGFAMSVHGAMYVLELKGVLPYAPLVRAASGAGMQIPVGFRELAVSSIMMSYPFAFVTANVFAKTVRRQRAALDQARSELRRVADQARVGRLSGGRIGDFNVEDLLGRGGMGEVYAAKRVHDGEEVAIKLLHAHLGSDDRMRMRFRREAEVVRKMPPATVATVHHFGTTDEGYDYIVMERLRGEDLGALLRRRERLAPEEVLGLVERLAVGLDAAHELGVVHRDLKPPNVFLCSVEPGAAPLSDVRLLDFGLARLQEMAMTHSMTASAAVLGTPGYMPPEQAGGGEVGPPADVFALGAIVFRALTGNPAFPSRSPAAALYEALHMDPPPPSELVAGLPTDVDAVLALALAKDPALRYQRASELARDLGAALAVALPDTVKARAARLTRGRVLADATMTEA